MAQEINLGGTIYIASKRAAEITGYTQDYVGQLARGGHITAQRVSGLWYVVEESLRNYKSKADEFKPTPPTAVRREAQIESSVSFDGKDYVSAQRAADLTGYHPDYVGQLARNGKVLSRQVGNRWFVDREAVIEHKRHNDALLAAVQTESVGLMKHEEVVLAPQEESLHFTYSQENIVASLPAVENGQDDSHEREDYQAEIAEESETEIPIRVIKPLTSFLEPQPERRFEYSVATYRSSWNVSLMLTFTFIVLITAGIGALYAFKRPVLVAAYIHVNQAIENIGGAIPSEKLVAAVDMPDFLENIISNKLYYRRDSF